MTERIALRQVKLPATLNVPAHSLTIGMRRLDNWRVVIRKCYLSVTTRSDLVRRESTDVHFTLSHVSIK